VSTGDLPSADRIGTVVALLSIGGATAGFVMGTLIDTYVSVRFAQSSDWADKLWKKGAAWGAFSAFTWYFLQWSSLG
jgi:hypothetical protein